MRVKSVHEYDYPSTPHGGALLQKQLASGSYSSPAEVVERALETLTEKFGQSLVASSKRPPAEAVADILENRKAVTLDGIKIKDLIHEGRKYLWLSSCQTPQRRWHGF